MKQTFPSTFEISMQELILKVSLFSWLYRM